MKYKMTVTIYNPQTPEGMTSDITYVISCVFHCDSNTYGNGYSLSLKTLGTVPFENLIDLRYDKEFNREYKMAYLERWAKNYWTGKDGAYAIKKLIIETV